MERVTGGTEWIPGTQEFTRTVGFSECRISGMIDMTSVVSTAQDPHLKEAAR